MAGEKIIMRKGAVLTIKAVHSGTKQDGTAWMQIHVADEAGKIEAGAFINPMPNLREGDRVVIDEVGIDCKRTPNRYAFNTKTNPFQKLDNPVRFITEATPQLTVHMAEGGNFNAGSMCEGGFGEGGFGTAGFDPNEGELPF